jgi:uncharacterized protein
MQKYMIYAKDGTDEGALDRRLAVRSAHFEGLKVLKANGNLIEGGALVNDEGKMIGSAMMMQFESKADFHNWYDNEPYVTQGVWKDIDIHKYGVPPPQ